MMESKRKRRRTVDASTQDLSSSGASPRSPGFPQWGDLPQHMQLHVLCSQGLSLRDLAKLAPTAKVFEEACLDLYEAELKWLVGTTTSAFGEELVGAAQRFLCRQDPIPTDADRLFRKHFDIRNGGALPADSELFSEGDISVDAPALGLLADGQTSYVTWDFKNHRSWGGERWVRGVTVWVNGHGHFYAFMARPIKWHLRHKHPLKLIAIMGLLLMVWQKGEEGGQAGQRGALMERVPRRLLLTPQEVSGLPEEAQRAYAVLHMWVWRTWRKNVRI
eukprot:jgi/Botrbrau1/4637/Bobra.33_2s0009.1